MVRCKLPGKHLLMLKKTVIAFVSLLLLSFVGEFSLRTDVAVGPSGGNSAAWHNTLLREGDYQISAYDALFRNICGEEGHDWRLVSAIAYHESRFRADLVSRRGARGLMQIMPSVARQFDISAERASEPEVNIRLANWLLSNIASSLDIPTDVPERDRLSILLASYNSGIGHVSDARRLARRYGEDPNSWEVVGRYLTLKADPAYYDTEEVKCGRFTGGPQTLAYVDQVLGCYDRYCRMTGGR